MVAATSRWVASEARADAAMAVIETTKLVASQLDIRFCVARNTSGDNTAEGGSVK